jgi:hypothetical protein
MTKRYVVLILFSSQQFPFLTCVAAIPEASRVLNQPVFLLNGKNFITSTADFPNQMKAFAPRLHVMNMDAGCDLRV